MRKRRRLVDNNNEFNNDTKRINRYLIDTTVIGSSRVGRHSRRGGESERERINNNNK